MFCSATPSSIYRLGYFSLKASMRVLSARSAHSATTLGLLSPSSKRALPNPSRVCAIFSESLMFASNSTLYFQNLSPTLCPCPIPKTWTRGVQVLGYNYKLELYHVLNRGVDKRAVVLDDEDRVRFLHDLFVFND